MLFSLKIIKVSFRIVALVGGPLFIIMAAIFIIAFFLLQKNNSNLVVKDDENIDQDTEEMNGVAPYEEETID